MLGQKRIPSREGGVEIVVEELSTRMVKLGHGVTCYNRKGHHVSGRAFDRKPMHEYKGIQLKSVFTIDRRGLAAMSSSFFAAWRAALGRYDVVHFHAEGPCAMMWLPKLFGKRCIATIHGLDHLRRKWGRLARACILLGEQCAVKFADEIIVQSEGVRKYFQDTYRRDTVFIPNGVTRPEIRQAEEITQRYGLQKDEYILFLGRIVPEKGILYLIEAFSQVDTDKQLVIAGGASDTDAFMKKVKDLAAGDHRILVTGFVQGRVLEELYSNAYFYVLPSDLEGMPLSLLEALSYGNCCLTSDIPECADVLGEQGVVFEQGNVDHLRQKLQMLCDNQDMVSKFRLNAADYVCDQYNWDEIVQDTLKLYGSGQEKGN